MLNAKTPNRRLFQNWLKEKEEKEEKEKKKENKQNSRIARNSRDQKSLLHITIKMNYFERRKILSSHCHTFAHLSKEVSYVFLGQIAAKLWFTKL